MHIQKSRRVTLIIVTVAVLALIASLLLTPLGYWVGRGLGSLWQGFANLPGIAWARQQMSETDAAIDTPSGDNEAINDLLNAGRALQQNEAYEQALQRYREALQQDDAYAPTHLALASLYMQLGREDEALRELEKVDDLAPDNLFVLGQLGQLYMQREDYDKGIDALQRATALNPEDAMLRYWLGVAYHYRSYADAERGVGELEEAAKLKPNQAEIYYHLAMAYVRRDDDLDPQRAIASLEKALELDRTETEAFYYLGQLYLKTGQRDKAIAAWREYVVWSDNPESVDKVRTWLRDLEQGSTSVPGQ